MPTSRGKGLAEKRDELPGVVHELVPGDRQDAPAQGGEDVVATMVTRPVASAGVVPVTVGFEGEPKPRPRKVEIGATTARKQDLELRGRWCDTGGLDEGEQSALEFAPGPTRRPFADVEQARESSGTSPTRQPPTELVAAHEAPAEGVVESRLEKRYGNDGGQRDEGRRHASPGDPIADLDICTRQLADPVDDHTGRTG